MRILSVCLCKSERVGTLAWRDTLFVKCSAELYRSTWIAWRCAKAIRTWSTWWKKCRIQLLLLDTIHAWNKLHHSVRSHTRLEKKKTRLTAAWFRVRGNIIHTNPSVRITGRNSAFQNQLSMRTVYHIRRGRRTPRQKPGERKITQGNEWNTIKHSKQWGKCIKSNRSVFAFIVSREWLPTFHQLQWKQLTTSNVDVPRSG